MSSIKPEPIGDLHFTPYRWIARDPRFELSIIFNGIGEYGWHVFEFDIQSHQLSGKCESLGDAIREANQARTAMASASTQTIGKWQRYRYGGGEKWHLPSKALEGRIVTAEVIEQIDEDGRKSGDWDWDVEGAFGTCNSREKAMKRAELIAEAIVKEIADD